MNTISIKAYAKINLSLDVIRRRQDNYHDVRMIMQTVMLHDRLTMKQTTSSSITLASNIPYMSNNESNLSYIAARLFMETVSIKSGVYIHLEKKIPISAGMAGGSTDAAATLLGMNELFNTGLSLTSLQEIGRKIGADVPYCLLKGTAIAEGIGELLTPLPPAPDCFCLIVKPPFGISTRQAYESLILDENTKHPDIDGMVMAIKDNDLVAVAGMLSNVFEDVATKEYPIINDIKSRLLSLGALGAIMSGSGPSVFGLFNDKTKARKAYYEFKISDFGRQTYLTSFYIP